MKISKIRRMDISNGPGIRISIFTQGCLKHCPGCFNPETWDLNGGQELSAETITQILRLEDSPHIAGLSILGGEPLLEQNLEELKTILTKFKEDFPKKTIWLWTGYTLEELSDAQLEIIELCDTVIDGPFIQEQKDLKLYFAGSKNQRLWQRVGGKLTQITMPTKETYEGKV